MQIAGTSRDGGNEENIRRNIFNWGPVTSGMKVYQDFYIFDAKNDIYEWNGKGEQVGGHAIEIIGWGETNNNKKYWIIKNSWGEEWGDKGYFKMARGINNCEIEENIIAGIPNFFYPLNYETPIKYIWSESEKSKKLQRDLALKMSEMAGGIDPETGYSRRVMATMPWLDLTRPIELNDLPNFENWIAGVDASMISKNVDAKFKWLYILIILIFLIFLILIIVF